MKYQIQWQYVKKTKKMTYCNDGPVILVFYFNIQNVKKYTTSYQQ